MTLAARWLLSLLLLWQGAALAAPQVTQAWIRLLPGDLPLAGYMTLRNPESQSHTLVAVSSPQFKRIEIHRSLAQSGMARMQALPRLELKAHAQVRFSPGGYHLMLFGRTRPLRRGQTVELLLQFDDGYQLSVPFEVRAATAR